MEGSKLPKPSGLRPPQIKATKPLAEIKFNRMLSNVAAQVSKPPINLRRSKSVTDIRMLMEKPRLLSKVTNKVQSTRPQTSKIAPKRKAEKPSEEVKPKIVKQAKIPDWDYKGRYNQLREKHIVLNEEHKKQISKLQMLEDVEQKYNLIQDQHNALEKKCKTLSDSNKALSNGNTHLNSKLSELQTNLSIRTKEYEELKENFDEILAKDKINSEKIEKLYEQNNFLSSTLGELKKEFNHLKDEHEKLDVDHTILKAKSNKLLTENETLSRNLDMETRNNMNLSNSITNLKQDVYNGEVLRRRLHNLIQDLKGNIRVFCRVRPPINLEEQERLQCLINYLDEKSLEIRKSRESISTTSGKPTDIRAEFSFDKVFEPGSSQEEIFEDLSQLVQSALDGYDICVFAYGQTGSGKTYTMQGGESLNEAAGWVYEVKASFLEIYNETVRDLLNPNCAQNLEIRYNEGKGTTVTNLTIQSINSADELKNWMMIAQQNRAVAATDFNEHSSRSHAVTKIYLHGQNNEAKVFYTGSINLVDLAGSESAKTSANERLIETKNINKSLSTLGSVMLALYNKEKHVPYRNSKLTYLLQSSLGGNSKTLMVVNIAPFEECYAESINSLRFAAKVKEVKMSAKRNKAITK
ncbi:hypothetical protein NQ314_014467 [Rhamnusium bicolor]|uniref:Kinesin-like protein n=1 Tax=Rhamnusium bicolor TaxID=1586634 RepID=A0AAV8X2Z9_9CUCU|nr:hypothetical protein NQ314_014467 [Rhamnusium bicolor]